MHWLKQSEPLAHLRRVSFTLVNSTDLQERLELDVGGAQVAGRVPPPLVRWWKPELDHWDEATNPVVAVGRTVLLASGSALAGTHFVELTTTEIEWVGHGVLLIENGTPYDGCAVFEPREIPVMVSAINPFASIGSDAVVQSISATVNLIDSTMATIESLEPLQLDLDDIQTRLPAALTAGGMIKASTEELKGVTAAGTSGYAGVDVIYWKNVAVAGGTTGGYPHINVETWDGQFVPTATTIGVPKVEVVMVAADALTASALAADAVTEIQAGLATAAALDTVSTRTGDIQSGTIAIKAKTDALPTDPADQSLLTAAIAAVQSDTDNIQTTIAGLATSTEVAAVPTATENAAAIWNALTATYNAAGSFGAFVQAITASAAPTAAEVRDAILDYSHDTGLTIRGAFRRMDALIAGKATGLVGSLARFLMRDGVTAAISAVQDVDVGTRSAADVTGSEA